MVYQRWSVSDKQLAVTMRADGHKPREIAQLLGRSAGSVIDFLRRLNDHEQYRRKYSTPVHNTEIPEYLLAAREKRANEPRTLTMMLCGDPEPSRSALGKRDAMVSLKVGEPLQANAPFLGS